MPDLPLDETALQAAECAYWDGNGRTNSVRLEDAISTYLREARFELEYRGEFQDDPRRKGIRVHVDTEARPVGPWVPVVQAESKEE